MCGFLVDHLVLESLYWILCPWSPLSRFATSYSLETQGPWVLTITAPHLMCLLFLCGPCSSRCRNCWSYLVHPSFSLVGEWNLDPLDWSWLEEGICLHYITKSKLHPLVLIPHHSDLSFQSEELLAFLQVARWPWLCCTDDITVILGYGVAGSEWHR